MTSETTIEATQDAARIAIEKTLAKAAELEAAGNAAAANARRAAAGSLQKAIDNPYGGNWISPALYLEILTKCLNASRIVR